MGAGTDDAGRPGPAAGPGGDPRPAGPSPWLIAVIGVLALFTGLSLAGVIYAVVQFNDRFDRLLHVNCVLLIEARHEHADISRALHVTLPHTQASIAECQP